MCRGSCAYLVDTDGPTIVDEKANVLQHVVCCSETTRSSTCFVLTTCQASVEKLPDNRNTFATLTKSQRDTNQATSSCSFHKKVKKGCGKCYDSLCDSYAVDGRTGCITSRESTDMKNMLCSRSRSLFSIDGHVGEVSRQHGLAFPKCFEVLIGDNEGALKTRALNRKKLPLLETRELNEK